MDYLGECITLWLTHFEIINDYLKYYNTTHDENIQDQIFFDCDKIISEINKMYVENVTLNHHSLSFFNRSMTNLYFENDLSLGYNLSLEKNVTSIELIIVDGDKVYKNNINNIINDYFDGIELNHDIFLNNVDEMISLIWFLFSASLHLRKYIITAKCEVIHRFLTKSGFIDDYEKLVHTISDTNSDFCISKKDVFDILHKFPNTTLAYHSNDKYYIISKKNGEYTVGYNFIVRHGNLINIVFWGKHNNDGIFSFPSIEEICKSYGNKNTIKRISISSLEGLYQISEFMINSIDCILYKLKTENIT